MTPKSARNPHGYKGGFGNPGLPPRCQFWRGARSSPDQLLSGGVMVWEHPGSLLISSPWPSVGHKKPRGLVRARGAGLRRLLDRVCSVLTQQPDWGWRVSLEARRLCFGRGLRFANDVLIAGFAWTTHFAKGAKIARGRWSGLGLGLALFAFQLEYVLFLV